MRILTATRTALAQVLITACGASATIKAYSGTVPTDLGTPAGTLLATGTFGSTIGTATAGAVDIDEASISQTNGDHVTGTPTFWRISTSGGTAIIDIEVGGGAGQWTNTGGVVNGTDVTFTGLTIVIPHATA